MIPEGAELSERVVEIVAETLDRDPKEVTPSSSLIDDLGAESIDFLDVVFRLESAFDVKIPEDEIWKGATGLTGAESPEEIAEGVRRLREKSPGLRWDRLPDPLRKQDLPRLITVQTILDYLERKRAA